MNAPRDPVGVLGAGSWGTALAIQFARAGNETLLWGREAGHMVALAAERRNRRYLPDAQFPDLLLVEPELAVVTRRARDLLIAVPSHAFRELLELVAPSLRTDLRLAWATKGFEPATGKLLHEVAREIVGPSPPMAVLSGPTFATEVGAGLPTAITIASLDESFARELALCISSEHFRAYTSTDIVGVEVGGAVKNVLAIGAGISVGLGFGANTRVALITRGLVEMHRLGTALGATSDTFMGLAGMGDLVLTCTDDQSRNRRTGLALGAGKSVAEIQAEIGQVVEGVRAARAVHRLARARGVEMPICEQVYKVLYEGVPPETAVRALMQRELKAE